MVTNIVYKRVICDFENDNPTMVTAEVVNEDDLEKPAYHGIHKFTFDKRKIGLKQVP